MLPLRVAYFSLKGDNSYRYGLFWLYGYFLLVILKCKVAKLRRALDSARLNA